MKKPYSLRSCAALAATIVLATCGCLRKPDEKLIAAINKSTIAAGMRPINRHWRLAQYRRDHRGAFLVWVYGSENRWAGSVARAVQLNTNSLIQWTEDYYYSGRKFQELEVKNVAESLTIHLDHTNGACAVRLITDNESLETLVPEDIRTKGGDPHLALQISDNILTQWKAKRED